MLWVVVLVCVFFFFQEGAGIRSLVRFRGLGDVFKGRGVNLGEPTSEATCVGGVCMGMGNCLRVV